MAYDSNINDDGDPPDISFPGIPPAQTSKILTPYSFLAILGHDLPTYNAMYGMYIQADGNNIATQSVANSFSIGQLQGTIYNGFSIGTFDGSGIENLHILALGNVGSMVLGTYYDMPHSPDLNLTMTREMDGVKRIRTKGGADLVKHQYTKPPMWGDAAAWELHDPSTGDISNQELSRSGRRVWDLSFSYLQDSDVFPEISNINHFESGYDSYNDAQGRTLLDSNNFFSQVIHKTNGGQLPFIFQPDKNNNNADGFAICKFDQKSFSFQQTAPNLYSVKMKIREVW